MEELHRAGAILEWGVEPSLLTSWTLDPLQLAPVALAALAYAMRARTLRARGTPVPRWRIGLFALGIVLLLARARVADRGDRRDGALQLPHAPARPARRPRAALPARRAHRAGAPAAARVRPVERLRVLAPASVALPIWAVNLYLWHLPVSLRGRGRARRGARARARVLLHRRPDHVAAGARDAAGAGVVRHRREARATSPSSASSRRCSATCSSGRARSSTASTRAVTSSGASRRSATRGSRAR